MNPMERSSDKIFDELLILRCKEKDQQALGLLWKRWQPKVLKWSFDFVKDKNQAYEVAQESWISIFKSIDKLKDPAFFRFWAYRIVQRRSADFIRGQQKERNAINETAKCLDEVVELVSTEEEKTDLMLRAIKQLPVLHQEILRLFYLEKYPVKLIAKSLRLPEGTVKSRLFYARKELKNKLKEVYHE